MFVYPFKDKEDVTISLTSGTNDSGAPNVVFTEVTKCTIQDRTSVKYDKTGKAVTLKGMLFKRGDLDSTSVILEGFVTSGGTKYTIFSGARIKDPLGKVHHIELELM